MDHLLLKNKVIPLEKHLEIALQTGMVRKRYIPQKPKHENESQQEYIQRVRMESLQYQFTKIANKFVAFGVSGPIITALGKFEMIPAEVVGGKWGVHYILVFPDLKTVLARSKIFIRIDSGCFSGMVLGDTTCDCKKQLEIAVKECVRNDAGIVIEIPGHDGRGWGEYKMANQRLMYELGIDTVEAAKRYYEKIPDRRTFDECVLVLRALGLTKQHSFDLGTNSPLKIKYFLQAGFNIIQKPLVSDKLTETAKRGLIAKATEWGHTIRQEHINKK